MSNSMYVICALNKLGRVDKIFFIVCALIVALIIAVYFLIPVFNKKQYREQRENLRKREDAFKSNIKDKTSIVAAPASADGSPETTVAGKDEE